MARAYLKIGVAAGKERAVRTALRKIPEVQSADLTAGEQDVIAVVEAASYDLILETVVGKVRKIAGVQKTVTDLILE